MRGLGCTAAVLAVVAAHPPTAPAAPAPDGRVYELVTPADKGGNEVTGGLRATADGNAVALSTFGTFGDGASAIFNVTLVARRDAEGWTTTSVTPTPATLNPTLLDSVALGDLSADLRTAYVAAPVSMDAGDQNGDFDVYAGTQGGAATWLSPAATLPDTSGSAWYAGRSADGAHVLVQSTKQLVASVPAGSLQVYDMSGGSAQLVSVMPDGTPSTGAVLGAGRETDPSSNPIYGSAPDRNAISADGSTAFFATTASPKQLYVRRGGVTTLVSASQRTSDPGTPAANGATYQAATPTGSRVLFTSSSPLTDDAGSGGGLYAYDVASGALRLLSPASSFFGVVRTSASGARTYFVAGDQLVAGKGTAGGRNLYLATDRSVRYVATLSAVDNVAWAVGEGRNVVGMSDDGGVLVFQSKARLTAFDNASKVEVYRFDATQDDLTCLSCRTDGQPPAGSASLTDPTTGQTDPGIQTPRVVTADGSQAFFETPDPLVPADVNGASDVYEVDAAGPHLVSPGTTGTESHVVDNGADGRDVFLRTRDALSAQDTDAGYSDIYDARVGGREYVPPPAPCAGEACRGPVTPEPSVGDPASSTATDTSVAAPGDPARTFTVESIGAAGRRAWARTGRLVLHVRVDDAAVVSATARARIGRRRLVVATDRGSRTDAGTVALTLRLSSAARTALRRHGRLAVALHVDVSDAPRGADLTVALARGGAR